MFVEINVKIEKIEIKFSGIYQSNQKKSTKNKSEQKKIKHIGTDTKRKQKMVKLFVIKLSFLHHYP